MGRISAGGGGRLISDICDDDRSLMSSLAGGGGGKESNDSVDALSMPLSSGGGGNENVESVIQEGMTSKGLNGSRLLLLLAMLLLSIRFGCCIELCPIGVPGELGVGVGVEFDEFMLSIEPRGLAGRRLSVPLLLPLLSSLRRRLCLRVRVPPRSGDVGFDSLPNVVSPTSFNCRVIDVNGKLGFIEGFRLIVPVGKSESKALFSSDKHPLELELDARDKRPLAIAKLLLLFPKLLLLELLPALPLLHCDGTDETMLPMELLRFDENLSSSSRARSSIRARWLSSTCFPYLAMRIAMIHFSRVSRSSAQSILIAR